MARHASLAEQLTALHALVSQPETVEPVKTNWQTMPHSRPAEFNPEDISDFHPERRTRIRPTINEIVKRLDGVTFKTIDGQTRPIGGDIERGENGAIIRMGKLRFSDGTLTEKAFKVTIDGKVVSYDARLPIGAMAGTSETQERVMGTADDSGDAASNHFVVDTLGVKHRPYQTGGKRRKGQNYSAAESRAMLAAAIENTPIMPAVEYCQDGVACGTPRYVDQFVGMKKGRAGESGSMAWADIGNALADRDVWAASVDALKDDEKALIDAISKAKGLRHVGSSLGFGASWAPTAAKRAMVAANDNLAREYKKRA